MYKLGKRLFHSLTATVYCSRPSSDDGDSHSDENMNANNSCNHQITPAVGRKRSRNGDTTPTLFFSPNAFHSKINYASTVSPQDIHGKPLKRVKYNDDHNHYNVHVKHNQVKELDEEQVVKLPCHHRHDESNSSLFLDLVPQDVLQANIFSFLTEARDHYALQLTCKKFHEVSNKADMLSKVTLTGDSKTGKGGILLGVNDPGVAIEKLYKFAVVGNQQAMYMIGMIAAYCHGDKIGVTLLRQNADKGCYRSAYTLGLILRDCDKEESEVYLQRAISANYLPACQEILPSQTVKDKFGDLDCDTLRTFFDPISLNRLLGRIYLQSTGVRGVSTSHCWNPCCGRWALKATQNDARGPQLQYPSKYLPPIAPNLEHALLQLLEEDSRDRLTAKVGVDVQNEEEPNTASSFCPRPKSERCFRVSRMKMCSSCRRAKYCSKLCQVYDWRSGQHKMECQYL
mmetsp:Transcript_17329/g.32825  ORF Transcript_17329/g.32825 Transcript_17329/m.32825 type:complete len:456 (+) Transcript_17329:165-1532(+)